MKTYPFSTAKHAHDIEFYWNRLRNTINDVDIGDVKMSSEEYDRLCALEESPVLHSILNKIAGCCGHPIWLTGPEIGLAKEIVAWASETRAATCIANGRYDLIKYC